MKKQDTECEKKIVMRVFEKKYLNPKYINV